jgi:hypothetical protein
MDVYHDNRIRESARELLLRLWSARYQLWQAPPGKDEFLRVAPDLTATHVLGLQLCKPEEISGLLLWPWEHETAFEVAGLLDRSKNTITVAQKFPLPWRRFTTAHELGHFVLHPDIVLHRDRPIQGGERANLQRPLTEREADLFAAEFLMPTNYVTKVFLECFGAPIDGTKPDVDLAFRLSRGSGRELTARELAGNGPKFRSLLIAKADIFTTRSFVPLHERFNVSLTAMSIQLLDLGLVR